MLVIDAVEKVAVRAAPKFSGKTFCNGITFFLKRFTLARLFTGRKKLGNYAGRVLPQRLYLYRVSGAWSHDPRTDFGVHPGELYRRVTGMQKSVTIFVYFVPCAACVP